MTEKRGTHFDPAVLDAFFTCETQIIETQMRFADL
jgi:response regulator RpfG family c-di-GMP phosphodiesterase